MNDLAATSRIAAADLRRAERAINRAARDTAQFLLTALDATETHGLSPAHAQPTVRATVGALVALVDGQQQLAIRAHARAERAGRGLGLDVTDWGEGAPKPTIGAGDEAVRYDW